MNLTPEEKAIGKENFHAAIGSELTRREFLMGTLAAGVVSGAGLGGMYYKYTKVDNPVRIGFIGTGDEGGVLIGALTPDYVKWRPSPISARTTCTAPFTATVPATTQLKCRCGLMTKYGWKIEDEAHKNVKVYGDYQRSDR